MGNLFEHCCLACLRRRDNQATLTLSDGRDEVHYANQGIVSARTTGKKSDGNVFMTYERSMLVPKRGHAVDDMED